MNEKNKKQQVKIMLEDMTFNSTYEFFEEGKESDELKEVAAKRGIQLPSKDIAMFKCLYAMVDKENKNKCTLPRKEVKKSLKTLNGKAIDKDHLRRSTIGVWLDAELIDDEIYAYGLFWKSNFSEEYEDVKSRMEEGKVKISFEAWGDRNFREDGSYELSEIHFAGGAVLFDTNPAFPEAEIMEFSNKENRVLEFAKVIEEEIEESKVEITEDYIRIRQKEPSEFDEKTFRTITLSEKEGIKAVVGRLKGQKTTTLQTYLFDKSKWTVKEVKEWIKKHKGSIEELNFEGEESFMEEAKLSFNYDNNTIARMMWEGKCPDCEMQGWFDVNKIDFDNDELDLTCGKCGAKSKMKLTPQMTLMKKGKKTEKASVKSESSEAANSEKIQNEGGCEVDEILKKYNKANVEEFAKHVEEMANSLTSKDKEIADLKKAVEEANIKVENSKIELEKVIVEAKAVKEQLDAKLAAEKAAFIKTRRDELGEEFAKELTDEDIVIDLKFENAKLKKELAETKKKVEKANVETPASGLEAGSKVVPEDEIFKKQKSIKERAFPQKS